MDRSYLSHAGVVAASRDFVCIRPLTYESATEAPFLERLFRGRSGNLENTVFAMLGPDGKTRLCRTGRSPSFAFRSPEQMASFMNQVRQRFPAKANAPQQRSLPLLSDVRRAINTCACDSTPLAIVYAPDAETRQRLQQKLATISWGKDHIGQIQYCLATSAKDLEPLRQETTPKPGILVVQPSTYGDSGQVISAVDLDADPRELVTALDFGLLASEFQQKSMRSHIARGRQLGVNWKTAIPVTDSGGRPGRRGPR